MAQLAPEYIPLVFYLTCFILVIKILTITFISVKLIRRRGEEYAIAHAFMRAMLTLIVCLLVSRLFYMVFDFIYTKFDTTLYVSWTNICIGSMCFDIQVTTFWKLGQLIIGCGLAYIVFIVDRKILEFKFKGIFAYIMIAGSLLTLFWPVNTMADFEFISTLGILPQLGMLILFFVFLNIARKSSGRIRTTAVIIILAFILYGVAALAVNAGLIAALNSALGTDVTLYMYLIQTTMKTVGIIFMAMGASRWGT
nr:hypothetical protein [Candidatus Sigynarchaeota archaeon]